MVAYNIFRKNMIALYFAPFLYLYENIQQFVTQVLKTCCKPVLLKLQIAILIFKGILYSIRLKICLHLSWKIYNCLKLTYRTFQYKYYPFILLSPELDIYYFLSKGRQLTT